MRRAGWVLTVLVLWSGSHLSQDERPAGASLPWLPGRRVLLDAHNCYSYGEWWAGRIDRALATGTPLAIEQDLAWYRDPRSGRSWSVLSHTAAATGSEPTMKRYSHGWFHTYNFGSIDAARLRWRAAIRGGADFGAVDQYEDFANELHRIPGKP